MGKSGEEGSRKQKWEESLTCFRLCGRYGESVAEGALTVRVRGRASAEGCVFGSLGGKA